MLQNFSRSKSSNPYSDIVVADDRFLFLSGLIAQDLNTQEVHYGNIQEETNLVLNNLKHILEDYGSDMNHVIRVDVLLSDFADRDEMNVEYKRHFKETHLPARLCFGNVGLHGKCKIEIAVIAEKISCTKEVTR